MGSTIRKRGTSGSENAGENKYYLVGSADGVSAVVLFPVAALHRPHSADASSLPFRTSTEPRRSIVTAWVLPQWRGKPLPTLRSDVCWA